MYSKLMVLVAFRLTEIGPRMTLQLVKIEEGLCTGQVLYHRFIEKTEAEIQLMREMRKEKKLVIIQLEIKLWQYCFYLY